MAQAIDPNNLDSIDALLDEAELESSDAEDLPVPEEESLDELAEESIESELDTDDSILDEDLLATEEDDEFEQLLNDVVNPEAANQETSESSQDKSIDAGFEENFSGTDEDEEFARMLASREQNINSNELTVEEMDTLKKLIIGFSSALIVLVLIAIGFALWAALASNSSNVPGGDIFEEIRGEAELGRSLAQANDEILKDLNKKLDALSFQIEQVNSDLLGINGDGTGLNTATAPELMPSKEEATPSVAPVQLDSNQLARVDGKIDSLTRSLSLAQNRVVEINNRVKSLQQQYTNVLQSIKQVEKSQLEQKVAQKKVEEEAKQEAEQVKQEEEENPYSYRAPAGLNYEAGAKSVYP